MTVVFLLILIPAVCAHEKRKLTVTTPSGEMAGASSLIQVHSHVKLADQTDYLAGSVELNGGHYNAKCSCSDKQHDHDGNAGSQTTHCSPSKVKLHQSRPGQGMSMVELSESYGRFTGLSLMPVASQHFSCLDDRVATPSLCTPGGDLGEFVLVLNALLELVPEHTLGQGRINQLLEDFVAKIHREHLGRRFYHCTDDMAVQHLRNELQMEAMDIRRPPEAERAAVLKALGEFENMGDSHLRLVLSHPEWYHIQSTEVVKRVIRAFYTLLWDESNPLSSTLLLEVLPGAPNPQAFVEVVEGDQCHRAKAAPLLAPRVSRSTSVLVSHMGAAVERRREIACWVATQVSTRERGVRVDCERLMKNCEHDGLLGFDTTGRHVAGSHLPIYVATFH
ncbi:unnamed protein product [Vitrella brassicaformis CCMP3155]|uniref:Uncharacterized protein n=1 Tax=Vitrella brassicaformis (strain CCMP3155) TaxID=1169540 RepID=A0A0G4G467_VITBC|nr:unnamed protein product [Vitrella brassicaformis CCMP3155]|eukprot:CEM23110.1 unnamed protein product [Vitrella brassicaformis CCMP3155]